MTPTEVEDKTRQVFHGIHTKIIETPEAFERLKGLLTTENLRLAPDYFKDKICADLGCGSAVVGTHNLLRLGAGCVHALDVTDNYIAPAQASLEAEPDFAGRWRLDVGSLTELPYEDEKFDFSLCQGVIHHLEDDRPAMAEIARTLKPGGLAHLDVHGRGGLLTGFVMGDLREAYQDDPDFRQKVDTGFSAQTIRQGIDWLKERLDDDGSRSYELCLTLLGCLRELLDEDLVLSLKDRMQAPLYKDYTEEELARMLNQAGFTSYYRVSRKPAYANIRKILAPLYHEYDSPLARLFYGEGSLIVVARK